MLNAAAILAIPPGAPDQLFRGPADEIAKEYRTLTMRWHPDRPENHGRPEAVEVFQRITELKDAADALIAANDWYAAQGVLEFDANDGRRYKIQYRAHRTFELGHLLIGQGFVAYVIRNEFADLYDNALRAISAIHFADAHMKAEFQGQLPVPKASFTTAQHKVLVLGKDPEAVLLRDLHQHCAGKLPAVHVAWMTSRALNIACWLEWAKTFHGDIAATSLFINPRLHTAGLLGGWWYAVPAGARLVALPPRTVGLLPSDVLRDKVGETRGDRELIRALGRELLGDAAGTRLRLDRECPPALADWALQAGGPNAHEDFELWPMVLTKAFGPKCFVELRVTFDEIYPDHP